MLPSSQIKMGASQLHGLIGSYTSGGHYWAITYSDTPPCTWSFDYNGQHQNGNWPAGSNGDSTSGTDFRNGAVSGTVVATLTWVPTTGQTLQTDPPSEPVFIVEHGDAYEQSLLGSNPNDHGPAGSVSDGLGDTPVVDGNGYIASGDHLISRDGSSGTITLPGVTMSAVNPAYSQASGYPPYTSWPSGQNAVSFTVEVPQVSVQGNSTVDTANWDPNHPRFFSGTNCNATANGAAVNGETVAHMQLQIGGTIVGEYDDTGVTPLIPSYDPTIVHFTGTNQSSASLTITFDSTHFADTSSIPLKVIVYDSSGSQYSANTAANAYNKAAIYGRNEWEPNSTDARAGTFIADTELSGMNHTDTVNRSKGWTAANALHDIGLCTVFYVNTHGVSPEITPNSPTAIGSDLDESTGIPEPIFPSASSAPGTTQVLETRQNAPVTVPPVNLAFLDCCETGTNNDFADAFLWPSTNGSGASIDQAEVGWEIDTHAEYTNGDGQAFWSSLSNGDTAHVARDKMIAAYFSPGSPPNPAYTYATVWGDYYTRIHYNAYTSDDNQPANYWFK